MYAAQLTRPDIAHAVGVLSSFNSNPGQQHWNAAKRVLRYLKGTKSNKLCFNSNGGNLEGFCDADWANDIDDRKSITGYVFVLSGGAISWQSRKQQTVALSTTEAKYMSLTSAAQEAMWLRGILKELKVIESSAVPIYSDNKEQWTYGTSECSGPAQNTWKSNIISWSTA